MPIFDNNGKKQNVQDAHVGKYMELYPDATTVMERDGKKYRVKAKDYNTFLGDTLEAPKMESAPQPAPQVEAEPQQGFFDKVKGGIADAAKQAMQKPRGGENGYTFTAEELERMDKPEKPQGTVWGEESIATVKLPEIKPINVKLSERQLKELREQPEPERNEAVESGSFLTDEHKKAREEFDKGLTPIQRMQMKDGSLSALNAPDIPKNLKYDYDFRKEFGYFPGGSDTEFWNFLKTKTGEEYQMKMFGRPLSDYEIAKLSEDARRLGFWGTVGQGFKGLGYGLKGVELELAEGIADLFGVEHAKENINEERERILTAQDNFKPTAEGFGGFVAEMIPQMTGTGLGLLVSAVNPVAGAAIVNASTAAQVASSMGSTALEARRAGASDAQTAIAMLLSGGAELLSEKYVNSKYIKRIMPKAADVVAEAGDKALESELNKLLQTARKELGGKFTAKTAKDLVGDMFVEGASEFSAEAVQALIPIVYEHKEDFPNIVEVFNAGLEGFAGGVFMGGIFGGTSSLIQNRANNQRRREQGFVDVANVEIGGKPTFVEVLGKDKDGNFVVLSGDETVSIKESQIKERKRFDYNDFRNAEVEYAREIGYEQEPTGENAVKEANEYTNARNEVVKVLILAEGADVDAMLEGRTAEEIAMGDTEVEDAVNNYIKARARRDGFRERYQEERDRQFAESDRSVDERTNNGTVYGVATENGEAFITSGTVVLNEEGEIDYSNSEDLVVMFPDGTKKPVKRGSLPGKVTVQNAEDLKAAGRASIEERWRAEFESAENAYVEQQKRAEGVVFDVTDKDGTHRVEVVKEGEEMSNVLVDGEQMQISTEMLNALRGEAGVTQAENGKALQAENGKVEGENGVQPEVTPVVEGQKGENTGKVVESSPAGEAAALEQNIPVDEKGKKMWEQSTPEYIAEYIRVRKPEDVEAQMSVVSGMIEGLEKQKSKMDAMDAMDIDDKIAFWKKVGELIGGAKEVVDPVSQLNAKHSSALTAFNSMLENIRREGNEQKAAIRYEGLENMIAELGKQLPEGYTIGVVDGKYTIVEAQPTVDTAPVVESAPVAEVETPQATNEMQEADLENGEKGQKAVEPVREKYVDPNELSEVFIPRPIERNNANEIEPPRVTARNKDGKIRDYYVDMDMEVGEHNINGNETYPPLEVLYDEYGEEFLKEHNIDPAVLPAPGKYRLLGYNNLGFYIDFNGGEYFIPGFGAPGQVRQMIEQGNYRGLRADAMTVESVQKAEAPSQSGVPASLVKGTKWEKTGEPDKVEYSRKRGDSHDITWYIGKKKYGSTTAERDLLVILAEDYGGDLNAVWNAYEQGEVLLSANEAAILKKLIETNTSVAELQQGTLELDRENPAFERATENVMKKLEATGVKVVKATKKMVDALMKGSAEGLTADELHELRGIVARGLADAEVKIVNCGKNPFNTKQKTVALKKEVLNYAEKNGIIGTMSNEETNGKGEVRISKKSIGKFVDDSASDKSVDKDVHLSVLPQIRDVIASSIEAEVHPDYIKIGDNRSRENGYNKNVLIHRCFGAVNVDGKVYRVKITLKEDIANRDTKAYSYEVTNIELLEGTDENAVTVLSQQDSSMTGAKLLDKVEKSYDKGTKLLSASKKVPDFMKTFHGSGAKFDKFDHSFMGTGEGAQAYGWGTYVTEVEGIGRTYATTMRDKLISEKHKENTIINKLAKQTLESSKGNKEEALDYLRGLLNESWSDKKRVKAQIKIIETGKFLPETKQKANLYTVEIPDDNGSNYLHWEEVVPDEVIDNLWDKLRNAYGEDVALNASPKYGQSGEQLYRKLERALGGDKAASEFLNDMGFVGISYPAQAMTGGRADKARNYVIFNENDAQIEGRIEFLRTSDGTTYGWAVNGEIYLTPEGLNPNTPIHEYTHLWAAALQKSNPKLWGEVVEAMKLSPAWNEVMADDNYTDIHGDENRVASEVLSRLSGNEGYRRYMEQAEAEIAAERDIVGKVQKKGILNRIKNAVSRFWNWLKGKLGSKAKAGDGTEAKTEPWDVFVNKSLKDFDEGVNPDAKDSPLDRMFMGKKGADNLDKAEEATTRLDNLNVAREMETAGKDAKAIKLATGWERGADRKWRYETEDEFKFDRGANIEWAKRNPERYKEYRRYRELLHKANYLGFDGLELPAEEKAEFEHLSVMWDGTQLHNSRTLKDYIDAPDLFEAYPELRDVKVKFETFEDGTLGKYNPEANTITLNEWMDEKSLKSTLNHEIQHAIQHIEGFARGGNISTVAPRVQTFREDVYPLHNMMLDTPEWAEKQRLLSRWLAEEDKAEPDRAYQMQLQERIDEIDSSGVLKGIENKQAELIKKYGYDRNVINIINEPYSEDAEIWDNLPGDFYDRYESYRRLAGEVESRNVEERMSMSPEERRNKLAEETEDVRREDQIFLEKNLGESASEAAEEDIPVESVQTQPMTFAEKITNSVLEASAKNKENLALRSDALRMFGRDVANILKLMGKQREYDKSTVDQLVKLAKMYFKDAQLLGGLTPYQVGRVMTRLNNAVGKRDITDDANELVNILVDAHNKELEKMLEKQAKTKAKKVNASGVEVIGKLDKEGQLLLEEYNAGKELDLESIDDKIIDLQNEAAEGKAEEAAARIRGLELARQYREEILKKLDEIKGLEQELKSAEQDAKDGAMDRAAYKEFRRATERAILESKLEMVDAYHGLIHGLGGDISSSAKRAKLFQQQQIDHVKEIQHNANSDLLGHPAEAQGETPDKWNSSVPRLFMSAMPTFQTMLKFFGEKAADGRGYLYERFIPQHTQASHNEYVGKTEAREKMREKLTEIFGKKTSIEDFLDMSRKDGVVLEYQEGGQKKTIDLTRGEVLYLYMINKMADGQMKLSRMGITDADVLKMAKELPEEMVRFADWVQEDFLTELREKYNKVHERMFGAPMAAIESYFPIKINKRSRGEKIEPGMNAEDKPSTVTGSVIKRTKNAVAIDLSADAMQVLLGHIDDMENWAAWAEFRRDVKSLLNYRHFQNQVKGMESLRYGSGEKLWKNFVDVANIAAGSFKPSSTAADRAVRNIAKGVVSSKIAFRLYTAAKQILSAPAFWTEVDFDKMVHAYTHQREAWKWAKENLPGFTKRWEGRAAGNEILLESDKDWKVWKNRFVEGASKWGMTPNAAIDALTVAVGAKAVYETKYEMFKKAGYSEERAKEKALNRAAEAYNESQQSSEGAYLSPLQAEATWLSSVLTAYRNSSFGYNRKVATAVANLKKKTKKGFKQESIEYMTKQLMRDGLTEEQALKFAKSVYRRSVARDAADVALFGFLLNFVWALGGGAIYLFGGDDEEEKKEILLEAALDGATSGIAQLPAGEAMTRALKSAIAGEGIMFDLPKAVAAQDLETIVQLLETDVVRAANELLNMVVAMGIRVNPQTFTDVYVALADVEDWADPRELAMAALRVMNSPNSQLDLLTADEAMENYGANIEEITREYAEYQKSKRAPLTGWLYSDESEQKAIERYEKRFKKILDERFESIVENTDEYDMWYENSDPQMKAKLAKLRQKFLEGDKETTMEKLDSIDVTKKVLFGSGYDEVNTVYYELSTAEDEDMAMMIDTKLKELQPMMDEYKKLRGDEREAYREKNLEQIQFYNRLNAHKNNVNNLKGAMKKKPEEAQEKMEKIRKIRTKAIDLINNYNE